MGKCMFLRKGSKHEAPISFEANFADNTWEQIIAVCQAGKVPDTWVVGDSKMMSIDGVDYQIDIIGKNHDEYADGSGKAPLTFQFHTCYATTRKMYSSSTNAAGWLDSYGRSGTRAIRNKMPTEVQAGIKEVSKMTSAGKGSSTIETTAETLFLLSEIEVAGSRTYSRAGEGTQYEYYASGNSKKKYYDSTAQIWWTRSPSTSSTTQFAGISKSGTDTSQAVTNALYLVPAFCF